MSTEDKGRITGKIDDRAIEVDKVKEEWRKIPEADRIAAVKEYLKERTD